MPDAGFHLSFYLLCALLAWIALRGILGGKALFEFPTLAATLGLAWVVPQGIELESNSGNPYASGSFWLYVSACFLSILWGFALGRKVRLRRIRRAPTKEMTQHNYSRLLIGAAGLITVGQVGQFLMRGIDTSGMGGQWTGIITMYALLSNASAMGLCLSVLIFAHTKSRMALLLAGISAIPLISSAIFGIRREVIFDLLVLTGGSWYLAKARVPPRVLVIALLLLCTVILNSAGRLRNYTELGEGTLISAVVSNELYEKFDYFDLEQGNSSEVRQAQYDFWYMNKTWNWEYGSEYWNSIVGRYVPAFLFGRKFKDDLQIKTLSSRLQRGELNGAYSLGSTRTGFSDSYRSFGVFGVFVFVLIGYLFGYLYNAVIEGSVSSQYYYLIILADGLKSITHSTGEFAASLPFIFLISIPIFRFAQMPVHRKRFRSAKCPSDPLQNSRANCG